MNRRRFYPFAQDFVSSYKYKHHQETRMIRLTGFFCLTDDFCCLFEPAWKRHLLTWGANWQRRRSELNLPELMTLAVLCHQLRFYLCGACRRICAPNSRSYPATTTAVWNSSMIQSVFSYPFSPFLAICAK